MKKYSRLFIAAAFTAFGFISCSKETAPVEAPHDNLVTVHFGAEASIKNADEGSTKATLTPPNEDEKIFRSAWENGDVISIKYLSPSNEEKIVPATWNGNSFDAALPDETGEWYYQACFPKPDATDSHIDFGGARTQYENNYNSAYDVMTCELFSVEDAGAGKTADGKDVIFSMKRETAVAYFHFTSDLADENIVSATLSIEDGHIASQHAFISDFTFAPTEDLTEIKITFPEKAPKASDFTLWFNTLPTTYSSMSLTVETTGHKLTINRKTDGMYEAGHLYKVVKEIPAEKWVATGGNTPSESSYTIEFNSKVQSPAPINTTTNASTFVVTGAEYLKAQPFSSITNAYYGGKSTGFPLRIGKSSGAGSITMALSELGKCEATKIILSAKQYSDGKTFKVGVNALEKQQPGDDYTNLEFILDGQAISSIKLDSDGYIYVKSITVVSGQKDNTIPTLSVDQTSKIWAYDETDAFVVNVTVNSEGGDWNVTPTTLDWANITVDKTAGTITITPNGTNTAEVANEATLTVSHVTDASLKKEISLKQAATIAITNDGSLEQPYTATEAIAVIDGGKGLTGKHVKGIVKATPSFDATYHSLTYDIESGGSTLTIYSGKDLGNSDFVGADDLKAGDEVIVYGNLSKYNNTTYELDKQNYLISINGETQIYRGLTLSGQKTTFTVGDAFEFGGKALRVWRGKEDVDVTESASFSGYDMTVEGTQTVTVTVGEETASYDITIKAAGEETIKTEIVSGTFTFADKKLSLTTDSGITITQEQGSGTVAVNATYNTTSTLRVYKGNILTFSGKRLSKIEIKVNTKYYGNSLVSNCGKITETSTSGGTIIWEGDSDNVTITNAATKTNTQLRPAEIKITYVDE